ncbi:MAG: sn-glycerol-3-phosphate ABC transporter ATP-binding protein UgpC [bacterium]|nr:sn-glycerol-3-phosphate ABC transporter ATP-binding protein UgpC [bacterium]
MASLTLTKISKTFNSDVAALNHVSMTVHDGEFVVLVGPSGCGKSTLLRVIAGLEPLTDGEIRLNGKLMNDIPPKDRDIAMVFQNYALYPHMTVFDNMAFALKMGKLEKDAIEERVMAAADVLGLTPFLDRKPEALSGGQRQRVAVGRAIVRQPVLFLFDEPLSNLDAKLRVAMRGELIKLHQRLGTTMIYVTHDQVEAMSMGDRLIVLENGTVQQVGNPLEIYNNPANRFVAGFIGSPPMNFLPAVLDFEGCALIPEGTGYAMKISHSLRGRLAQGEEFSAPLLIGVRPEGITLTKPESIGEGQISLPGDIEFLEPLGNETLARVAVGQHEVVCRLEAQTDVHVAQRVTLYFEESAVRFFHQMSGERIL